MRARERQAWFKGLLVWLGVVACAIWSLAGCTLPPPVIEPTPPPTTTLPPAPQPTPTPFPVPGCSFPQGIPDEQFTPVKARISEAEALAINQATAKVGGCEIGSDCPLGTDPQAAMRSIVLQLRRDGYCAGQHVDGDTDELAFAAVGQCAIGWHGAHVVKWPNSPGDQAKASWVSVPTEPCHGEECRAHGGRAYRGMWRIPSDWCSGWTAAGHAYLKSLEPIR